ncbi:MAG TPA: four helix bundle protein [Candidatus Paceibacterota bacterium]
MGSGYRDLIVWQKSKKFCVDIYKLTEEFPKSEIFGLTSQLRRAAVSIPSNIAEGSKRNTPKDQHQFYAIAYGSGAETETQLEISKELFPHLKDKMVILENDINEIMKMLNKLRNS